MKNRNVLVVGIPLTIAILAVVFLFQTTDEFVDVQDKPPSSVAMKAGASSAEVVLPVEVSIARRGPLVRGVQTQGIVRAKREVKLIARVSGEVVAVFVRRGQGVHRNQQSCFAAGDSVIVSGHYTLAHDARIRIEGKR